MTLKTLASTAAVAATFLAGAAPASPKSADIGGYTMSYQRSNDRFCLTPKTAPTGTRLRKAECKTREQWKAEGLTVERK